MSKTALLSRTAIRVQAALTGYLAPKLAMDAKLDLTPVLKDVTAKNFQSRKLAIMKGARDAADPMMTPEATAAGGAGPDDVIMRVLDMVGSQVAADPPEMDAAPPAATMPNGGPPAAAAAPGAGPDDDDPQKKLMAFLQGKLGEDDMLTAKEMMGAKPAEDEDGDAEGGPAMTPAMDKKGKKATVTQGAMDAALDAHGKAVEARVMKNAREIAAATQFVRPWVGEIAMDSADNAAGVYRKALTALGVAGASDMHPDALKAVLEAQPKPGDRRRAEQPSQAMDSAAEKSLAERFPHAANIQNLG